MRMLAPYVFGILFAVFVGMYAAQQVNAALERDIHIIRLTPH